MIKDFLISFKENLNEKTRNPFLGTYLLVWIIRNWILVYSLFNFDKGVLLEDRITYIKNYYAKINLIYDLFTNIYYAILLLILTYFVLNISRLIVNFSEKQLTPLMYKVTDSKSIVLKSVYQNIVSERDELQLRLDQERDLKFRLEVRIKKLEEELIDKNVVPTIVEEKKNNDDIDLHKSISNDNNQYKILLEKIKHAKKLQNYMEIAVMINKNQSIPDESKDVDLFIQLGLITFTKKTMTRDGSHYRLTISGNAVLNLARLE